jgi:hypothetical protein
MKLFTLTLLIAAISAPAFPDETASAPAPTNEKDAYVQSVELQLSQWHDKTTSVIAKKDNLYSDNKDSQKRELATLVDQMRDEENRASDTLDDLKRAPGDDWKNLKPKMDSEIENLSKTYEKSTPY